MMKHSEKGFLLTPGKLLLALALVALAAVLSLVVGVATTYNKTEPVQNSAEEQVTTVEILSPDGRTAATAVVDRQIVLADEPGLHEDAGVPPQVALSKPVEKKAVQPAEKREADPALMPSAAPAADSEPVRTAAKSVQQEERAAKVAADEAERSRLEQQRAERVAQAKAELAERAKARVKQQERQAAAEAVPVPAKSAPQKEVIDNLF